MKVLDRIALVLFSSIILIFSILFCLVIFGWINIDIITLYVKNVLNNPVSSNITLGVLVVFILLAIKGIFFSSDSKNDDGIENGILIQNENGKLFISKDTIQNLVSGVVKQIDGAQDISSKVVLSKHNNILIDVIFYVTQDVILKDLSNDLQLKIKDVVKKSMDIDIKEVNVRLKNIAPNPENTQV